MSDAIEIVRHPRARRARLRLDPATGALRLTLPKRAALAPALKWVDDHRSWIAEQRAKLPVPRPFVPGAIIPIGDSSVTVIWSESAPRRIIRDGIMLHCGGPAEGLSRRITTWLRREALRLLSAETAEFAGRLHVSVGGVAVGDPRGRWGSCSTSGVIRYSWRLILAPDHVRRATVAHEVAHRVHMNHGPDFHALVGQLVGGDAETSRDWLRHHGAGLHWFGRES